MEAKIQISGKGIAKIVGVTCLATGAVALSKICKLILWKQNSNTAKTIH